MPGREHYLAVIGDPRPFGQPVQRLLDEEVPERAQWLRVIHLELNRVASHLFWLATGSLDIGAITMLWWGLRERDLILDLFEMSSGQRMHTRYFQVGGVFEDIPSGWEQKTRTFSRTMPERVDQFLAILMKNEIVLQRLRNVAPLDA